VQSSPECHKADWISPKLGILPTQAGPVLCRRMECGFAELPCAGKISKSWGCSSAGRAPRSQRGGQRFDPAQLHHKIYKISKTSQRSTLTSRAPRRRSPLTKKVIVRVAPVTTIWADSFCLVPCLKEKLANVKTVNHAVGKNWVDLYLIQALSPFSERCLQGVVELNCDGIRGITQVAALGLFGVQAG
jgi:hypothetical protein